VQSRVPDPGRKDLRLGSGISVETLIIASLASAVASFAASRIWGSGTLVSAAATPVVVALISEFLRRPVQTVAASAKQVPKVRSVPAVRKRTIAAPGDPMRVDADPAIPAEQRSPSGRAAPRRRVEPPAAITPNLDPGTITYYGRADTWRPRWRPAVVTGLVAFAIVVALYTVPDLLAGRSITGNGQPTTFFGGSATVKKKTSPTTTTVTTTTATTTATKTAPTTTTTPTTTTAATSTTTTTTTTAATSTTNTTTPTGTHSTTPPAVNTTTTQTTPAP
jgi:hypothetical protein